MNRNSEYIGFVTQFSLDRLVGFLFPLDIETPKLVKLFINGHLCAEQIASQKSPVLVRHELGPNFQFDFDLRIVQTIYWDDEIKVTYNGHELAWTHQLLLKLHKKGVYSRTESRADQFFFLHVPKTAGTSFRMMLYNQFKQKDIWPNKSDLEQNRRRYPHVDELRKMSISRKNDMKLIMGHYKMAVTREFHQKPVIITFLRDPMKHIYSLASHKQRQMSKLSKMKLTKVIKEHIVDNPQTRFFLPPHTHDDVINFDLFKLAVRNLNLCDFVGVQDQFDEGLTYLENKFNWSLGRRVQKNVGKTHKVDSKITEVILNRTKWDLELYKTAQNRFKTLLNEL